MTGGKFVIKSAAEYRKVLYKLENLGISKLTSERGKEKNDREKGWCWHIYRWEFTEKGKK